MITSRLTSKAQTTIPQPIRSALGVGPGDEIGYVIEDGRVLLTKVTRRSHPRGVPFDDPFAAFSEWGSAEDDEDFVDL
jgi:antitoxin PrlF